MRIFCAGWENRCQHPNFVEYDYLLNAIGNDTYPDGGVEGIGHLLSLPSCYSDSSHRAISMHHISGIQSEIFMNCDIYIEPSALWRYYSYWSAAFYWDQDSGVDVGYLWFDVIQNRIYYSWGGMVGSAECLLQFSQAYNIAVHLEILVDNTCRIEIRVDGFLVMSKLSVGASGLTGITRVGFGSYNQLAVPWTEGTPVRWDNVKINDPSGIADNSWPAPSYFIGLPVTGPSAAMLSPFPGPPNWANVDDLIPNDADYNYTANLGDSDVFTFADCPTIVFDTDNWLVSRFLINSRHSLRFKVVSQGFTPLVKIGGVDYLLSFEESYFDYVCYQQWVDLDPSDSGPWDQATIDAMLIGVLSDS